MVLAAQEITKDIAKQLGISRDAGVIVTDVEEGSPADDVGIQPQRYNCSSKQSKSYINEAIYHGNEKSRRKEKCDYF